MGKNYVENSLKRFLKRKVKITMGFVVAFMIMGTGVFAADAIIGTNKETKKVKIGETEGYTVGEDKNLNITLTGSNGNIGTQYAEIDLNGNNLVIEINENKSSYNYGIFEGTTIKNSSEDKNKGNITLKNNKENKSSMGVYAKSGDVNIEAGNMIIDGFNSGIFANKNVIINISNCKAQNKMIIFLI